MNIEKETFNKLVEMGWMPPENNKPKKYELSDNQYAIEPYKGGVHSISTSEADNYLCYTEAGATRKTKEAAQLAAERMRRVMRLSALAAELGGEKKFVAGEYNWYFIQDPDTGEWMLRRVRYGREPEKVYMTEDCGRQILRMLSKGGFEL